MIVSFVKNTLKISMLLFLTFHLSCVSADRSNQRMSLSANLSNDLSKATRLYHEATRGDLRVLFYELDANQNIFSKIFSNFIVDNQDAAMMHLSGGYIVTIAEIINSSNSRLIVGPEYLRLPYHGRKLDPVLPDDFPRALSCINWKGNIKNVYNITIIAAVTAVVAASIVACAKKGDCDGVDLLLNNHTDNDREDTNSGDIFSNPVFTTRLDYEGLIDPLKIEVPPGGTISTIVLYKKPYIAMDSSRITTSANCVIR